MKEIEEEKPVAISLIWLNIPPSPSGNFKKSFLMCALVILTFFLWLLDLLLDDGYEGNLRKEGRSVRIVVAVAGGSNRTKVQDFTVMLNY